MHENLRRCEHAGSPRAAEKRVTEEPRTGSQRMSTEPVNHLRHPLDRHNEHWPGQQRPYQERPDSALATASPAPARSETSGRGLRGADSPPEHISYPRDARPIRWTLGFSIDAQRCTQRKWLLRREVVVFV